MKKIILIIIFFFISAWFNGAKAQDYDSYCPGGTCWEEFGGSGVFYSGCEMHSGSGLDAGNYCAGTGAVGGQYCTCRSGHPSYEGGCTCDLNYVRNDNLAPECVLDSTGTTICYCVQQPTTRCSSNVDCRSSGVYPADLCNCNTYGQACIPNEIPWIEGCCYYTGAPTNTPAPTSVYNSPIPTTNPSSTPNPSSSPAPDITHNVLVSGNFYLDSDPDFSAANNACSGTSPSAFSTQVQLTWYVNEVEKGHALFTNNYQFTVTGVEENDRLSINAQVYSSDYKCSCPIYSNICRYSDVLLPAGDTLVRHFYYDNVNRPDSWFQTFGSSAYTAVELSSLVPSTLTCILNDCHAAVFAPQITSTNALSSGFPLLGNTIESNLLTHEDPARRFENIHLTGQRSTNVDSFVLGFSSQAYNYDYFKGLADNSGLTITTKTPSQTDFADWVITPSQTNFFLVNDSFTIDQSKHFNVGNNETVVVFVEGSLTITDNGSLPSKIISVARKNNSQSGGFLAFFVRDNIIIDSSVGKSLDYTIPELLPITHNNTHLEGVFFSDEKVIVEGDNNWPNKKIIIAGTLVGLNGIELNRQADDLSTDVDNEKRILNSIQALENFVYRPDLLINWPSELRSSIIDWQEVAPRSLD